MADTLFFVHPDDTAAAQFAARYGARGWNVATCDPRAADALDRMASADPVAAVFCLVSGSAFEAEQLAARVLSDGRLRRPLMVFVGGFAEEVESARGHVPFGVFVSEDELQWVLKRLVAKY